MEEHQTVVARIMLDPPNVLSDRDSALKDWRQMMTLSLNH
jgi:hypothetical protein